MAGLVLGFPAIKHLSVCLVEKCVLFSYPHMAEVKKKKKEGALGVIRPNKESNKVMCTNALTLLRCAI